MHSVLPATVRRWQHHAKDKMNFAVCEWFTRENLRYYEHPLSNQGVQWLFLIWMSITWPVKMGVSFLFNLWRTRNLVVAIQKRLGKGSVVQEAVG